MKFFAELSLYVILNNDVLSVGHANLYCDKIWELTLFVRLTFIIFNILSRMRQKYFILNDGHLILSFREYEKELNRIVKE